MRQRFFELGIFAARDNETTSLWLRSYSFAVPGRSVGFGQELKKMDFGTRNSRLHGTEWNL